MQKEKEVLCDQCGKPDSSGHGICEECDPCCKVCNEQSCECMPGTREYDLYLKKQNRVPS